MRGPFSQEAVPELLEGPHMHLDIDVARHRGITVLSPRGDLDVATAERLREAVTDTLVAGSVEEATAGVRPRR